MLFIYLLEDYGLYSQRAEELLLSSQELGDALFTSYLAVGEVMAGYKSSADPDVASAKRRAMDDLGFSYLAFDDRAVAPFSAYDQIRESDG